MRKTSNGRFAIKRWDEKPYSEGEGQPKLTRASVSKTYTGDLKGEGQVEYLMMYRSDGSASFVGLDSSSWDESAARPALSCSSEQAYSRADRRRSPIPSSPTPPLETWRAWWATAAPPLGMAWSILSP